MLLSLGGRVKPDHGESGVLPDWVDPRIKSGDDHGEIRVSYENCSGR
jgi:hypothetical protein